MAENSQPEGHRAVNSAFNYTHYLPRLCLHAIHVHSEWIIVNITFIVAFEILTAVFMKTSVLWDIIFQTSLNLFKYSSRALLSSGSHSAITNWIECEGKWS
jgi:hypothetical protein